MRIIGATAAAAATPVATETASVVFVALVNTASVTVAGRTVTSAGGNTAIEVATAMSGGTIATGLAVTGALNGFTAATTTTATAVFTSITPSANVADITVTGTITTAPTPTITQGSAGAAATVATATPVLNSIENVFFGAAANGVAFDARSVAGVTGVQFDAAAGAANSVSVTTGQSVTLSNTAVTNTTTIAGNAPAALNVNLNKVGAVAGTTDTVDFSGTALATVNINSTGAASTITLTNSAAPKALATLNITGDQGASITTTLATVKTVNASAATGAVSFDKSAATANATFAFTGGSANDTLKLQAGDLALLTSGAQLNGGAGTGDKLVTLDTTFAATDYAKINATVGFEVLGTGAAAAVVDAGQLTSIKSFSIDGDGIQAYTNLVTGSSFAVTAAHAATIGISTATGVSDVSIAIGTATTAGLAIGGTVTLAGATTVALSSNGTNAAANVISTLSNVVNSNITITGSNDLTITSGLTGTLGATGSVVNAAAFTGKLTVTGSGAGDIITGGSGVDIITGGSGADIVTGGAGAGADIFVFSGAAAANTSGVVFGQADVITDFVVGVDKLQFSTVTDIVSGQQIAVQAAVTALAAGSSATQIATAMATASTTALGVSVATFGGNTYVLYETSASAGAVGVAADDVFIQLTGVASGFTFANSVIG